MNSNIIHIIHPEDNSTDFLNAINEYVAKNTNAKINLLRLKTREEHSSFFDYIHTINNNELILFFGHGTSTGLSGAMTNEFEFPEFITERQLKIFENKNLVLLSCRSNQYLTNYFKECNLGSAIGFPNLITDYSEIEHHDDPVRFKDINPMHIELFKNAIVEIVMYSLEDYILNGLSLEQFYNRLKLRINKRVINLYNKTPDKGKLPLGKMLNDMVDGLIYLKRR